LTTDDLVRRLRRSAGGTFVGNTIVICARQKRLGG